MKEAKEKMAKVEKHKADVVENQSHGEEVNADDVISLQKVYHGSGADFDHSHMGDGEGAQAYGWGTYVTEVEGIGRMYAKQNARFRGLKE